MTAPAPVPGNNPWQLTYQTKQYDTTVPPQYSVLDALAEPSQAALAAEVSPANVFAENASPPPGAGGNEPAGWSPVTATNVYAQEGDDSYES